MGFVVAELAEGEAGGFRPRGALRELWRSRDREVIVAGPAETGKTWGCLQYADALLWKYPGAQGVMARKTYAALVGSAVRSYLRILGPDSPVKPYGGEKPEWFQYPNGSRFWCAGLDNPGKALSSERDFIYVNQAEEIGLDDWQTLTTRATGRGAVMPYTRVFGDCNPGPPSHWILSRRGLRLLESRHEDNPTLFDEAGGLTAQGVISLGVLDALTGVLKERLRHGKWVQQEGAVYEEFDRAVHVVPAAAVLALARGPGWVHLWSVDFGFTNPFCWQHWALDPDGRMFLLRELYRTGRLVADLAREVRELAAGWPEPAAIVRDHDAEDGATWDRALAEPVERDGDPPPVRVGSVKAWKAVSPGIQAVQGRLRKAGDGRPRLFLCEGALLARDETLARQRLPVCTEQEFGVYAWPLGADGKPRKEEPVKLHDHGMDALRYAVAWADRLGRRMLKAF